MNASDAELHLLRWELTEMREERDNQKNQETDCGTFIEVISSIN